MSKDSIIQVRISEHDKLEADELFTTMGTSTSEAVRLFIRQCLIHQRIPFEVRLPAKKTHGKAAGMLAEYASGGHRGEERSAWLKSLTKSPDFLIGNSQATNPDGDRAYRN